jgi:hypothetical protein
LHKAALPAEASWALAEALRLARRHARPWLAPDHHEGQRLLGALLGLAVPTGGLAAEPRREVDMEVELVDPSVQGTPPPARGAAGRARADAAEEGEAPAKAPRLGAAVAPPGAAAAAEEAQAPRRRATPPPTATEAEASAAAEERGSAEARQKRLKRSPSTSEARGSGAAGTPEGWGWTTPSTGLPKLVRRLRAEALRAGASAEATAAGTLRWGAPGRAEGEGQEVHKAC